MTPQMRQKAQEEFENHAKNDFYAEWFWFPYTSKVSWKYQMIKCNPNIQLGLGKLLEHC